MYITNCIRLVVHQTDRKIQEFVLERLQSAQMMHYQCAYITYSFVSMKEWGCCGVGGGLRGYCYAEAKRHMSLSAMHMIHPFICLFVCDID